MAGKIITIDWPTIAALPSDEYHIKLLNKQQAAVLQALCEYQHWQSRWDNLGLSQDELDRFMGDIEYRLMGDESGGFMTPQEMTEAICDGLVCAFPRIGLMLAQGASGGGSIDDEGNIVLPDDGVNGGAELPEDDPITEIDETEAARYGGGVAVGKLYELLLDKVDGYYGPVNGTPVTSATDTKNFINAYFKTDTALMDAAIDAYYAWRATNNRIIFDGNAAFYNYLYCKGMNEQGFSQYVIDILGGTTQKQQIMMNLVFGLADEAASEAFARGALSPSTGYLDSSCVPIEDQTLTALLFAVQRSTTIVKASHRMLFIADGYALDADGDIQDFFWYRTAAGVNTFTTPTFTHSAGANLPSSTQVPYRSSHHYEWTIDLAALANNPILITMNKHANMNAVGLTYPVPFSLTIKDLGEVF